MEEKIAIFFHKKMSANWQAAQATGTQCVTDYIWLIHHACHRPNTLIADSENSLESAYYSLCT